MPGPLVNRAPKVGGKRYIEPSVPAQADPKIRDGMMAGGDAHPRTLAVVEFARYCQQSGETLAIRHDVEKLGDRRRRDAERWLERPFVGRDQSDHEDDAGGENDHGGELSARLVEMHRGKADLRHQAHQKNA